MPDFTIVRSARDLHAGDYISWPTHGAPWHHYAIVVDVTRGSRVKVIHVVGGGTDFSALASSTSCCRCGWVEQIIDLDKPIRNGNLRHYNYLPRDCITFAMVVENSRSRLVKCDYDTFCNNCEHFARWCKIGNHTSHQGLSFAICMHILAVAYRPNWNRK